MKKYYNINNKVFCAGADIKEIQGITQGNHILKVESQM
jgi:enoyl-CoA hydratase/carnithine racemase